MSMAQSPPPQQPVQPVHQGWGKDDEDEEAAGAIAPGTASSGSSSALVAAAAAATAATVSPLPPPIMSHEIKELWSSTLQSLYNEMKEIGKALTCSICQATFHQPVLLPCVHAFCKDCLTKSLRGFRKCPICMSKATPRSFMDAPFLEGVVHSYKELLRALGMTPIVYDDAVGMTQLPPSQDVDDDDDDTDGEDGNDSHVAQLPFHLRGKTPSLIECSTHLALSRLWQQAFLQEQQQLPPDSELERKKLSSLLLDQNRVVAVDERVLVRAAAVRHHVRGNPPKAPPPPVDNDADAGAGEGVVTNDTLDLVPPSENCDHPTEKPRADKKKSSQQASSKPQKDGETSGTVDSDKPASIVGAAASSNSAPLPPPVLQNNSHLTVSQQAHEECMDDARDQHTADRSGELEEDEDSPPKAAASKDDERVSSKAVKDSKRAVVEQKDRERVVVVKKAAGSSASVSSGISWVTNTGKRHRKYGKKAAAPRMPMSTVTAPSLDDEDSMEFEPNVEPTLLDEDNNHQRKRSPTKEPRAEVSSSQANKQSDEISHDDKQEPNELPLDDKQESDNVPFDDDQELEDVDIVTRGSGESSDDRMTRVDADGNQAHASAAVALAKPETTLTLPAETAKMTTASSPPPETSVAETSNDMFSVGDVVEVQRRMWSGINRPGGTARVTKVYDEEGSYFYDVVYVLGGRERKLDAIFVSASEANMGLDTKTVKVEGNNAAKAKKSRRLESKEEEFIPPALLALLSAEGFDTSGLEGQKRYSGQKRKGVPDIVKSEPNSDGKKRAIQRQRTAKSKRSKSVGDEPTETRVKSRANQVEDTHNASQAKENEGKERKGAKSITKAAPEANRTKRPLQNNPATVPKRRKSSATQGAVTNDTMGNQGSSQPLTDDEKCDYADNGYVEWFNGSIDKSVVNVVASGLTEGDKALLDALCKESKKGDVKVILTESFHPNKTTLCLVSVEKRDGANLVSRCRTLKTMRAALAGIPIVDSAWIKSCKTQKNVSVPRSDLFVRSLPTKTAGLNQAGARFGVAALAARIRQMKGTSTPNAAHPLHGVSVFLCGSFKLPKKADVQVLLRESGCAIIPSSAAAVAKLSMSTMSTPIVLLCDDEMSSDHCGISIGLAKAAAEAIENRKQDVIIVNTQWLFDCISCCDKLPPGCYQPHSALAKGLWEKSACIQPLPEGSKA